MVSSRVKRSSMSRGRLCKSMWKIRTTIAHILHSTSKSWFGRGYVCAESGAQVSLKRAAEKSSPTTAAWSRRSFMQLLLGSLSGWLGSSAGASLANALLTARRPKFVQSRLSGPSELCERLGGFLDQEPAGRLRKTLELL